MSKILPLILIIALTSGCVSYEPAPTQEQAASAHYGEKPTMDQIEAIVKKRSDATLKDPYSAKYQYKDPKKAWTYYQFKVFYGYGIQYSVNSKNGYGAYAGYTDYQFLYNDGALIPAGYLNFIPN